MPMMRHHSPRSERGAVESFPLVKIVGRHVPVDTTRTRLGVGPDSIDHAAGLPLDQRDSSPPPSNEAYSSYEPAPSSQSWAHQEPALQYRDDWSTPFDRMAADAPVQLPLDSRMKTFAIAVVLFLVFGAICVSIVATGISSTVAGPHSAAPVPPPAARAATATQVGALSPASAQANPSEDPATNSKPVTTLPAAGFGAGAPKVVRPGAPVRTDFVPAR